MTMEYKYAHFIELSEAISWLNKEASQTNTITSLVVDEGVLKDGGSF